VVFDTGGKNFRHAVYPAYKAQRPPTPPELSPQFALARAATSAMGLPTAQQAGVEADDVIASYAHAAYTHGHAVRIVSVDKDLMQLITHTPQASIALYHPMQRRIIDARAVEEKFGVPPAQLRDLLALMGDASDNVPGVPGIGPKKAAMLLQTHGNMDALYDALPRLPHSKQHATLLEHREQAFLSRTLVTLRTDLPLPIPLASIPDTRYTPAVWGTFAKTYGLGPLPRATATRYT
jgi:DNA polymerase-1